MTALLGRQSGFQISVGAKEFSHFQEVHIGNGADTASYSAGIEVLALG